METGRMALSQRSYKCALPYLLAAVSQDSARL